MKVHILFGVWQSWKGGYDILAYSKKGELDNEG